MKRILLVLMVLTMGLLAPAGLYAQKVYAQGGKAIFDMTVAAGMPAVAVTNVSKTAAYSSYTPYINSWDVIDGEFNTENKTLNNTVYQKLEIALRDLTVDGTFGNAGKLRWVEAFNYCRNVNIGDGTGWRLPTQRELMMMCIFKEALDKVISGPGGLGGTAFVSDSYYWSATEYEATRSWSVHFGGNAGGNTVPANYSKADSHHVRCVREIP